MNIDAVERWSLLGAVLLFFLLGMLWPTLRLYRRTGKNALVLQQAANPFQRTIGLAMATFMAAVLAWGALVPLLGREALAIWPLGGWCRAVGWSLILVGLLVTLMAQAQMGASWRIGIDSAPTELVTAGLFQVVRNPIFTGMLLVVSGLVLVTPSPWTVMGWWVYVLLVSLQVRLEEQHLLALHGVRYREYATRVGRFFPGIGRLPTEA